MPNPFATSTAPRNFVQAPLTSAAYAGTDVEKAAAKAAHQSIAGIRPATDKQVAFIEKLFAERDWQSGGDKYVRRCSALNIVIGWANNVMAESTPAEISRAVNNTLGRKGTVGERVNLIMAWMADGGESENAEFYKPLTSGGASTLIELLMALPSKGAVAATERPSTAHVPTAEEVSAGRYAVETTNGATNELAFYKVDRPTEGRWAGYVFVKLMLSDAEQRLSRDTQTAILRKIAEVGAEVASARYGHEIGECGVCGRTLTNDESRARGIGPRCAAKSGW